MILLQDQFTNIIFSIINELEFIEEGMAKYSDTFPKEIKNGLVWTSTLQKDNIEKYFDFTASVSTSLVKIESDMTALLEIMEAADAENNSDLLQYCNNTFIQYEAFKHSVNLFVKNGEDSISKKPSACEQKLFSELNTLIKKRTLFFDFLKSISI